MYRLINSKMYYNEANPVMCPYTRKQCMAYYNERAYDICWLLGELDKDISIKEELEKYQRKHGE